MSEPWATLPRMDAPYWGELHWVLSWAPGNIWKCYQFDRTCLLLSPSFNFPTSCYDQFGTSFVGSKFGKYLNDFCRVFYSSTYLVITTQHTHTPVSDTFVSEYTPVFRSGSLRLLSSSVNLISENRMKMISDFRWINIRYASTIMNLTVKLTVFCIFANPGIIYCLCRDRSTFSIGKKNTTNWATIYDRLRPNHSN